MDFKNKYLNQRYEKFELESEIDKLKLENDSIRKENKYLKSTKAFKAFKKYLKRKDAKAYELLNGNSTRNLKDIKVAIIADQFTYDSFKYEFRTVSILPDRWEQQFESEKPDLFFCESVWDGHNYTTKLGPWRDKVSKDMTSDEENRGELLGILKYCRKNSIPSVFWNKEDPPHYRGEKISYAETAKEFDYIFTSSEECIKHYKKDFNHKNVYSLMFAAQPKLFNPLYCGEEIDEIVFAGSYYENHPERVRLMDDIFDRLIEDGEKLLIFDRNYYKDWANYPERFSEYVNPPLEYTDIPEIYKKMKWGLNFNIVTQSQTMFARRVFELALSNVYIITNSSVGVEEIFKDNIFVFDKRNDLPDFSKDYEKERLDNLYNVLENHTYTERWKQILDTIGFNYTEDKNDITVIYRLNDANTDDIVANFREIDYEDKRLWLLVDDKKDFGELKGKFSEINEVYSKDDLNQIKGNLKTEFWMLADEYVPGDFVKKAMLHYKYLNRKVSIAHGEEKFILDIEKAVENKVIHRSNIDFIDDKEKEIDVYYI